jgi:hypothetical protein
MEALGLLFGLLLVVILFGAILFSAIAALQGMNLAAEADRLLAFLSIILIFPCVIYGYVFWLTGKNIPQKLMDDLREKQKKDEAKCRDGKTGTSQATHENAEHASPEDDHEPDGNGPERHGHSLHSEDHHQHIDVSVRNTDGKALIDEPSVEKK